MMILERLSPQQQRVVQAVQNTSAQMQMPAYLVGGAVRDGLLRCPQIGDLDFVIEGDAIAFARILQQANGGEVQPHEKFRTATWTMDEAQAFDFATARAETYPRPAMLPQVTSTDILTDLKRRDFAINAIALRLSDGELLDPFDGQGDVQRGVIRILHPRSFIDEPFRPVSSNRFTRCLFERFAGEEHQRGPRKLRHRLLPEQAHLNRRLHQLRHYFVEIEYSQAKRRMRGSLIFTLGILVAFIVGIDHVNVINTP